jgi:hypothetical protein
VRDRDLDAQGASERREPALFDQRGKAAGE